MIAIARLILSLDKIPSIAPGNTILRTMDHQGSPKFWPMHLGVFNIKTGKVIMDLPCEDLKTYKLKVEDAQIFIEL